MGVVYRALDPVLNRPVAIKVMSDALARDDELRKRFLREAQAAGSLQHPNVVTIYDFGEVDGHLFIAMEFVEGEDLETLLQRHVSISLAQRIDILVDVLGGLSYAHRRGIVHRDIKPANIRIDDEGRARIMDFGIAHLSSSTMTRTGFRVGTPAYMAPEQVTSGPVTPATDIFSVGAVMYELFTGTNPFDGDSLQSVFYKIVNESPPDLTAASPGLPPEFNPIAKRALAKDPRQRYASAVEMANALAEARAALDNLSTQPKAISLRSSIETGLRARTTPAVALIRRRPIVIAAAVVIVAGVGGIAALFWSRSKESSSARSGTVATVRSPRPTVAESGGPPVAQRVATAPASVSAPNEAPAPTPNGVKPLGTDPSAKAPQKAQPNKQQVVPPAPAASVATPTARELELFRTVQGSALEARRRAGDAGATADQLQSGDDHSRTATILGQQGKLTDAATHLNLAITAWSNAERDARNATAAAATAKSRATEAPKQEPVAPQSSVPPVQPPVSQRTAGRATAPPLPPQADAAAEIESVLTGYARAIESRDVANVKRAYPGATAAQASGFEQFFATVRSLHAAFSIGGLDIKGDAAEARVAGTYEFVTTAGKSERQPVTFQASFQRENGAWRLVSVR
jgi:serine/threonine-protein kinase